MTAARPDQPAEPAEPAGSDQPPAPAPAPAPAAGPAEATITELARRYNVSRQTVWRALRGGRAQRQAGGPGRPAPVNPDSDVVRYRVDEMDAWWPTRPGVGAPAGSQPAKPKTKPKTP